MIKNKKIYLGVLSAAIAVAPVMSVVACGENSTSGGQNTLYDQIERAITERLNLTAQTNSTSLAFNNSIFVADLQENVTANDLGLIFANGAMPAPSMLSIEENYIVTATDPTIPSVSIQASFSAGDVSPLDAKTADNDSCLAFAKSAFFTITNFEANYDLSKMTSISPMATDKALNSSISSPADASALQINNALTNLVQEYLNEQAPSVASGTDYDIANLRTIDNSSITDDNLMDNARSFKVDIAAQDGSSKLQGQTTVTINFPKLDLLNLSSVEGSFTSTKGDWNVDNPQAVANNYIIKIVKKQILEMLNSLNSAVTWDDIFTLFYTSDGKGFPQTMDLTSQQSIIMYLVGLPYSQNAFNDIEISITLPQFP